MHIDSSYQRNQIMYYSIPMYTMLFDAYRIEMNRNDQGPRDQIFAHVCPSAHSMLEAAPPVDSRFQSLPGASGPSKRQAVHCDLPGSAWLGARHRKSAMPGIAGEEMWGENGEIFMTNLYEQWIYVNLCESHDILQISYSMTKAWQAPEDQWKTLEEATRASFDSFRLGA